MPALNHAKGLEFETLQLGISVPLNKLKSLIHKRLIKRLQNDLMVKEVRKLHRTLSWNRLEEFGLEYRFVAQYLQNKTTYQEMADNIQKESEHYVKRQLTWFKRDKRIHWVKNKSEAVKQINNFLK